MAVNVGEQMNTAHNALHALTMGAALLDAEKNEKISRLEAENATLRVALQTIRDTLGHVCPEFELCTHLWCADSYAAWATADTALSTHEEDG